MPTTYGNDIVYCLKSQCGVREYCRQKWVLQVQLICKFSNDRTFKRNKDVQGLSCGFEVIIDFKSNFALFLISLFSFYQYELTTQLSYIFRYFHPFIMIKSTFIFHSPKCILKGVFYKSYLF